jgi:thioredoxin-related protein
MVLRFLLLLVSIIIFTPIFSQNKIKWNSWDHLSNKVDKGDRKFLVYFYYDGCKWCKVMEESTLSDDQIAKFINNNFYAYKMNALSSGKLMVADKTYTTVRIDKFDFNELAVELLSGNMSFPAVVFMNEKFIKLSNFESYMDVQKFEMILSYYAGDHYKNTMWKRYANNYCRDNHFNSLVNDKN